MVGIHSRVQTYTLNAIKQYMVLSILKVYGLEHFKYDARKRNKNGSQQRRDEIKIKQSSNITKKWQLFF